MKLCKGERLGGGGVVCAYRRCGWEGEKKTLSMKATKSVYVSSLSCESCSSHNVTCDNRSR